MFTEPRVRLRIVESFCVLVNKTRMIPDSFAKKIDHFVFLGL